jgi:hypothetical protein
MASVLACQDNLLNLPTEIIINVLVMLDVASLKRLMSVCKYLKDFIFTHKKVFIKNSIKQKPYETLIWSTVKDDFLLGLDIQIFTISDIFEYICIRNRLTILHIQNIRELKMLFIMLVHFYKINANIAARDISKLHIYSAYHYYIIISKYPDIVSRYLEDLADDIILLLINNYENMDDFYNQIDKAVEIGGRASDAYHTILLSDYNTYYNYLEFGIPTKDAETFSYSGYELFSEELLMTYKGLIPIIGKTYGVYFVLEMNMEHESENFLHVLSVLYRHNIENLEIAEIILDNYSDEFLEHVVNNC